MVSARVFVVVFSSLVATGCGGGGDDGGGADASGGGGADASGSEIVDGTAHIVKGPSGEAAAARARTGGPLGATDGHWLITPDEAQLTFVDLTFMDEQGQPTTMALTDCAPLYTADADTLSPILDCPFEIARGTYISVSIGVSTSAEVLIADAGDGIYTDPASDTGLAATEPAGGPAPSTLTVPGPGGEGDVLAATAFFATPFVVDGTAPVTVSIVQDMIHTVFLDASAGGTTLTFDAALPLVPAQLIPSVTGAGRVEYYSPRPGITADNYYFGDGGTGNGGGTVRIFFPDDGGQPASLWHAVEEGPSEAYAADPASSIAGTDGARAGGFLGVDASGDACWALPTTTTYETYSQVCVMHLAANVGDTTTLSCDVTETAPAPTSGDTYASGCPAITADNTSTMTLVGR